MRRPSTLLLPALRLASMARFQGMVSMGIAP